jgi:hypothetical protein
VAAHVRAAQEREQRLAEHRRDTKDFAVDAVEYYMEAVLRVTWDELLACRERREQLGQRQRLHAERQRLQAVQALLRSE